MKRWVPFVVLLCGALCATSPALAARSDIFTLDATDAPNVVILIDTSGSMDDSVGGQRKINIAKNVITDLIEDVDGVNFGIFSFNAESNGGKLVAAVGTPKPAMIAAIDSLRATGSTPLGRAAEDVQLYYKGLYTETAIADDYDDSGSYQPGGNRRRRDNRGSWGWGGNDEEEEEEEDEDNVVTLTYESPIDSTCQKNFAILMTDGMPNGEDTNLVADVARSMYTTDHSTELNHTQNVIVHTIGFNVPQGRQLLTNTANNGGGTFYTADDAAQLQAALHDALSQILDATYTFAQPLLPTTTSSGGDKVYIAGFKPDPSRPFWTGYLRAYRRGSNGLVPTDADGVPLASYLSWEAGDALSRQSASTRTIYTAVSGTRESFTDSNSDVTRSALGVTESRDRTAIIEFIRGVDKYDWDLDGNTSEQRAWKLGSIYHSNPVLVFPPPLYSSDTSYQSFKAANANRTPIVLTGANDGMVHAFHATNGAELWGFIPPNQLSRLKDQTSRVGSHKYFVDSSPVVADVKIGSNWKTVAVVGQGEGGNYYMGLDITDTTSPGYMWNFTDSGMGQTWSEPAIGKIKLAGGTTKWVAFMSGGFDTNANDLGRGFYVVDLSNGSLLWDYEHGTSNDKRYMDYSFAGSPTAVDLGGDGFIDRVYAADVGGQVWAFDVSAAGTLSSGRVTNWTGKRLFAADPGQSDPGTAEYFPEQGMYVAPAVAVDEHGDLWVYVGTGDLQHPRTTSENRFYGIKDDLSMTNGAALDEDDLVSARSTSTPTHGWVLELDDDEKVFATANVFSGIVYFSTYLPTAAESTEGRETCGGTGTSRLYGVKMGNGHAGLDWTDGDPLGDTDGDEQRFMEVGDGAPSKPVVLLGYPTDTVVVGSSEEGISDTSVPRAPRKRMRYWREVM